VAQATFDVVIVGAGVAGSLMAKYLGAAGKKVLVLEAGAGIAPSNAAFMQSFFTASAKVPESPYPPGLVDASGKLNDPTLLNAPRPTVLTLDAGTWQDSHASYLIQNGPLAFASTYERIAGGTGLHWLGTSLRFVPNDFRMADTYARFVNWPLAYSDLEPWYAMAEREMGVSADVDEQGYEGVTFGADYRYPMPGIPASQVDGLVAGAAPRVSVDGVALKVRKTPAARNSIAFGGRPPCLGNTNCIPICPIGAKYDPSMSLKAAIATGNVTLWPQTVATQIVLGDDGAVVSVDYVTYATPGGPRTGQGSVTARTFVVAAHAIESPKLLLMSTNGGRTPHGIANGSGLVGKNLMDHPLYLAWALAKDPVYGYRGPLSTSGIESVRDGTFRKDRAAFRIEVGNEGWNFPIGDPETTTLDFVLGRNASALNAAGKALSGNAFTTALNHALTRQFRLAFLIEQSPEESNAVTLARQKDHLGIPRPQITYDISDYTKNGFVAAKRAADALFSAMGAEQFTSAPSDDDPTSFALPIDGKNVRMKYFGAGHVAGTLRMGDTRKTSVVNADQRSWDHHNLFLVGSATFPTIATGNPTLTLAALALRTAKTIASGSA
jgi:glucose dehydrogenase